MKYKVGDKVRVRRDLTRGKCGKQFVVGEMLLRRGEIAVITKEINGCYFISGDADPWLWTDEMLEPIRNEKIVITSDGVTTIARKYDGKNLIKEAKAVCSKDDTFNFDVGAKLAMERLMKEDKPKLYNGKVVCVSSGIYSMGYTKGKIYQFENGSVVDDDGTTRPILCEPIACFEDLEKKYPGAWLEVAE